MRKVARLLVRAAHLIIRVLAGQNRPKVPAQLMTDPRTRERHQQLSRELEQHNHRYYVLDAPVISDAQYDVLFRELTAREKEHPELVTPSSPSQRVGASPREGFVKVKRAIRMFSLDNAYSEA